MQPGHFYRVLGQPYTFSSTFFTNSGNKYFLFDGAGIGKGELVLTITQGTNVIAKTSTFMDLKDVKDMFEHTHAENVTASVPPSSLVSRMVLDNSLPTDSSEAKQMIVFVHGINNTPWDTENTAQTMFKRLYWSGYQGRFSAFRWPCAYLPPNTVNPLLYNLSEYYAWKSAAAFKTYLTGLRSRLPGYAIDIIAHSQGNVVASEALEEGALFDNYILSQGAIPAHCYDTDTNDVPFLAPLLAAEASSPTPFYYTNGGYEGYFTNLTGNIINFYNTNDFALISGTTLALPTNWEENQRAHKPDSFALGPSYLYYPSNQTSIAYYNLSSYTVTDFQEAKALVARSRSHAIGAQNGAQGVIKSSIDLGSQFQFGRTRPEHSAQFTRPIQTALGYYQIILNQIQPTP